MTPQQTIKHMILKLALGDDFPTPLNGEDIDAKYEEMEGKDRILDAEYSMREGSVETNIPSPLSRNYESKSVAAKSPTGQWVGWTYWYGGGKHGDPESIEWMNDAYFLNCVEEEKLVTVRTFTKSES